MTPARDEEIYHEGLKDDFQGDESEWWAIHHKKIKKTRFVKTARTDEHTKAIEA